jgi:hypothetical protein
MQLSEVLCSSNAISCKNEVLVGTERHTEAFKGKADAVVSDVITIEYGVNRC